MDERYNKYSEIETGAVVGERFLSTIIHINRDVFNRWK